MLDPIAPEIRRSSERPLPPDPAWLSSWLATAGAQELAGLREVAATCSPALREAFARFPPGCVVRCACNAAGCSRCLAIVAGAAEHPERGILLLVRRWPEDVDHTVRLDAARYYQVEHLRGGVTPELVRALFAGAAGSA